MTRHIRGALIAITLLGCGGLALADDLSVRERVYVNQLAKQLGLTVERAEAIRTDGGVGVQVHFEGGASVTRLRFPNATDAVNHAGRYPNDPAQTPTVVQARGNQALLLRGEALTDAKVASRYLDAGWDYLRGGDAPVTMTGFIHGDQTVGTTGPNGAFYDAIGNAVAAADRRGEEVGVQDLGDGLYRWDGKDVPVMSVFQRGDDGGTAVVAPSAYDARQLVDLLEGITGRDLGLGEALARRSLWSTGPFGTKPKPTKPKPTKPKPTKPSEPTEPKPVAEQPKPSTPTPPLGEPLDGAKQTLDGLFD